jgi:hypothetical protein
VHIGTVEADEAVCAAFEPDYSLDFMHFFVVSFRFLKVNIEKSDTGLTYKQLGGNFQAWKGEAR